jgi:hypothetical protein
MYDSQQVGRPFNKIGERCRVILPMRHGSHVQRNQNPKTREDHLDGASSCAIRQHDPNGNATCTWHYHH